ncbi:NAD(P)/FAD-dependent oxidoreductase [Kitasatospora atroaurantiaca]|uniref:Phytoene dehydrogenase-like protein n=1 Tax=Kitasatospora atroaurantiaca TaxID=285545 RepID=A0A561ELW7_9ACTN|nr:NAD(P)/FAD-dependent oxidoreductase [Kitasatospora atroaurantiaca]TWE16613.1 phytoene dehydrogenase-like protein [Kitasatospora atroaurantiaca]
MARIVIIGAGMSGLAAASRLATLGHRVTVCEASGTYGGMVGRYERDGFSFDTGPSLLTLPAVYRDLALKTGKEPLEALVGLSPVDPESRHLFPDGTDLLLPNASRGGVGQALDTAFGLGSGERWGEVMNRARAVWEATRRPLLEEPLPADPRPLHTDPYPAPPRRGLARLTRRTATLADVADRELGGHPGLTALLYEYALRAGLDPREAPAGATVLPYMEQSFGVWYVRGGLRALADAVFGRCEQRGVEFHFDTPVTEVLVEDGRACGVAAGDRRFEADLVLSAMDAHRLAEQRIAPVQVPAGGTPEVGRLTVLLALSGARPAGTPYRTVVHARDNAQELDALFDHPGLARHPTVQVHRPDDPLLVPDAAHEAVSLTVTVPVKAGPGLDAYADHLLDHLAAAGLDLRERVLWREILPPTAPETPPSLAGTAGRYLNPPNRSTLPGLHLIGATAHPGGGLARAGMSASITAGVIGPA